MTWRKLRLTHLPLILHHPPRTDFEAAKPPAGQDLARSGNQGRAHRFRAGVVVPIFDFFRIADGKIKELRPYFDPKPLREAA